MSKLIGSAEQQELEQQNEAVKEISGQLSEILDGNFVEEIAKTLRSGSRKGKEETARQLIFGLKKGYIDQYFRDKKSLSGEKLSADIKSFLGEKIGSFIQSKGTRDLFKKEFRGKPKLEIVSPDLPPQEIKGESVVSEQALPGTGVEKKANRQYKGLSSARQFVKENNVAVKESPPKPEKDAELPVEKTNKGKSAGQFAEELLETQLGEDVFSRKDKENPGVHKKEDSVEEKTALDLIKTLKKSKEKRLERGDTRKYQIRLEQYDTIGDKGGNESIINWNKLSEEGTKRVNKELEDSNKELDEKKKALEEKRRAEKERAEASIKKEIRKPEKHKPKEKERPKPGITQREVEKEPELVVEEREESLEGPHNKEEGEERRAELEKETPPAAPIEESVLKEEAIKEKPEPIAVDVENKAVEAPVSGEKLEKLKQEAEQARKEYAEMDYKKNSMWKNVRDFFGKYVMREEKGVDPEVAYTRDLYENRLAKYKDALLEDLKGKNLEGPELTKELKKAIVYFDRGEILELWDAKTQARVEHLKENKNLLNVVDNGISGLLQKYNKLSLKTKIAISLGVWASGAGFLIGGKRVFSALLMGTATAKTLDIVEDWLGQKIAEKRAEREVSQFGNIEEDWKYINDLLGEKITAVDKKMQSRKLRSLFNIAAGTAVGIFIAHDTLEQIGDKVKELWSHEEATGKLSEKLGAAATEKLTPPEHIGTPEVPVIETPEASIDITVEKGSSLEGSIIDHIKAHPELETQYENLNGGRDFNIGQIAHRLALDYAHEHADQFADGPPSLIHPGAHITIDPHTLEITNIEDSQKLGYLHHDIHRDVAQNIEHPVAETNVSAEANYENAPVEHPATEPAPSGNHIEAEKSEIVAREKMNFESSGDIAQIFAAPTLAGVVLGIRQNIAGGDINRWKEIKDQSVNKIKSSNASFKRLLESIKKYLGDPVNPKRRETFQEWSGRIARMAFEQNK